MKPILLILALAAFSAHGAGSGWKIASGVHADSLLPVSIGRSIQGLDHATAAELLGIESNYWRSGDHLKTMARLLELLGPQVELSTRKVRFRLFVDLAGVTARLRLYPLAMRCFYNALKGDMELPRDSGIYRQLPVAESVPVDPDSIVAAFGDGKEAAFYALLLEVKQPVPGKRKAFKFLNNVGHTFITLIKYNQDGSIVSRSFGFYPRKAGVFSATPFDPSAPSVFKDDSHHEWDEAAGRILTFQQFRTVLKVLKSYDRRRYHLNYRNCTDFGLDVARSGGIGVWDAAGNWPLGHGNNPGSAGQSLLEGKLADISPAPADGLLVIDNRTGHR